MVNLANKLGTPTTRRRMLINMSQAAGAVSLLGLGLGHYTQSQASLSASTLRPPGALDESDFLGACVRCGLCVRDCPYDTLSLAYLGDAAPTGTPFFEARKVPCEMCDDIPCVKACPTGALDSSLTDIDKARMGIAVLVDQETCLNFQGLRCDVCYRVCPLINKAITLEPRHSERTGKHAMFIPVVHSDQCTGCGKCEYACVLKEAAIKVLPQHLAKGQSDQHYQMGWKEKQKAGESLVTPDTEHQYNLPEGYQYEHAGRGLVPEKEAGKKETAND